MLISTKARESPWPWLLLIVLVAAGARLWHLAAWDAWTDELHTIAIARTGEYSFGPAYRVSPLNFILTGWVLKASGGGLIAARMLGVAVGLTTVIGLFVVGRRWFGPRVGLIASGIMALSMWHVYWTQVARHFALETLAVLVALHGVLWVWRTGRWTGGVLAAIMFLLGLFTHSSAGFVIVGVGGFVGGQWIVRLVTGATVWPRGADTRHAIILASLGVAAAIYLPAYLIVGRYLLTNIPPWNPPWNVLGSFAFYTPFWLVLPALGGAVALLQGGDDTGGLLLCAGLSPILLATAAAAFTTSSAAYALPSLVPIALLTAVALEQLIWQSPGSKPSRVTLGRMAALVVLAGLLTDLALYHTYYRGLKPRWKEAVELVAQRRASGDLVVASEADVAAYYLQDSSALWPDQAAERLAAKKFCAPVDSGHAWYVLYLGSASSVPLPVSLREMVEQRGDLVRVFPSSYGPKMRTLAVYRAPLARCD